MALPSIKSTELKTGSHGTWTGSQISHSKHGGHWECIEPLSLSCRSGRNLPKLVFNEATALNTYDVLRADRILMDKASLSFVNTFYGAKGAEAPTTA